MLPTPTLAELVAACPDAPRMAVAGEARVPVAGIATDSRAVRPGFLFAALAGGRTDGHRFLGAAASAGASALLVASGRGAAAPPGPAVVEAPDVRAALGAMADRFFGHPSAELDLVAVTGTNGKTTVTYLLEAIAGAAGLAAGVIGTIECRFGGRACPSPNTTPEAVDLQRTLRAMADERVRLVAMEASSHALALGRLAGCRVRAAVFTNLGRDHMDFHPDLESYFAAKARLFTDFAPEASIVNVDDPWGRRLAGAARGRVITYGTGADAAYRAAGVESDAEGVRLTVAAEGRQVALRTPLVGRHNAWNVLAAAAAARAVGIPWEAVAAGVAALALVPGRFERVAATCGPLVFVDFAHTPEAIENALRAARDLTRGRLAIVFGCGGDRDRGKRPLMGAAAARLADAVFVTSDNPRSEEPGAIVDAVLSGARSAGGAAAVRGIPDRRQAIREAIASAGAGDLVLIAGKGHEDYQVAAGVSAHFSDREEAQAALAARGCGAA
jgi:UDP-N-acetylmuramoyl-L-alanyl-D-glutamate--2,6-diaminopimelate ligase